LSFFPAVKVKHIRKVIYIGGFFKISPNALQYYFEKVLNFTPIGFYEHAIPIPGPRKKFFIPPRLSNSLLAILKHILELKQWTNRNKDFSH
jgi:hypothetical protein